MKVVQLVNSQWKNGYIYTRLSGKELVKSKWIDQAIELLDQLMLSNDYFTSLTSKKYPLLSELPDKGKWNISHFENKSDDTFFLVLKDDNLVGVLDSYSFPEGDKRIGYLCNFIVSSDHRGKGVGRTLIESAISFYKSNTVTIMLDVYSLNKSAIKLYSKVGFTSFSQTMILK